MKKKRVNVFVENRAIYSLTQPILRNAMNIELTVGDIQRCIWAKANVEEILEDGTKVKLNLKNFDKDNSKYAKKQIKKVEEKKPAVQPKKEKLKVETTDPVITQAVKVKLQEKPVVKEEVKVEEQKTIEVKEAKPEIKPVDFKVREEEPVVKDEFKVQSAKKVQETKVEEKVAVKEDSKKEFKNTQAFVKKENEKK